MASTIFNLPRSTTSAKTYISQCEISPVYLDSSQPPEKRTPFRQILKHSYVRNVSICLPRPSYTKFFPDSDFSMQSTTIYHKAILSLGDILSSYDLRTGNHIVISSDSVDDVSIRLNAGTLTLDMPHAIYQRCGLPFQHNIKSSKGRKHEASSQIHRHTIDLRKSNMVRGHKAFDRLMYAAQNVKGLMESRIWLCTELAQNSKKRKRDDQVAGLGDLLSSHHPTTVRLEGPGEVQKGVLIPGFLPDSSILNRCCEEVTSSREAQKGALPTIVEDDFYDVTEYLSLLTTKSSIITEANYGHVDSGLCGYRIPEITAAQSVVQDGEGMSTLEPQNPIPQDIVHFNFHGFMAGDFVMHLVVDLIRRSRVRHEDGQTGTDIDHWAVMDVALHNTEAKHGHDGYTILLQSRSRGQTSDAAANLDAGNSGMAEEVAPTGQPLPSHALAIVTCFEHVDTLT